jgi:hypothetical protein
MEADFGVCLALLGMYTTRAAPHIDLAVRTASSSILAKSRTALWRWGEDNRADYILFLDADHTFPPDALLSLLKRKLPVVGAHYRSRRPGISTSIGRGLDGELLKDPKPGDGIEEVSYLGLGLCLIDMRAAKTALAEQARKEGRSTHYPLFAALPDPDGARHPNGEDKFIGEDVYFFDKLRAAGLKIHADHDLSVNVGHIGEQTFAFPQ